MRWLLLLSIAEVLTMTAFANYSAALPILRRDWALTAAQAGIIFAAQQLGYTAAVLVLSALTDVPPRVRSRQEISKKIFNPGREVQESCDDNLPLTLGGGGWYEKTIGSDHRSKLGGRVGNHSTPR